MEKAALGNRLKDARIRKGYTQQVLAEKIDIADMYLSEIERGVKTPSLNIFIKIVKELDVSADFILRDEIPSGKDYVYDEITKKLDGLTPKQRKAVSDLIDAYIKNV